MKKRRPLENDGKFVVIKFTNLVKIFVNLLNFQKKVSQRQIFDFNLTLAHLRTQWLARYIVVSFPANEPHRR